MSVYLDSRRRVNEIIGQIRKPIGRSSLFNRSRLSLVPLNSWEVFASWRVRTEDRSTLLDWLGTDAPRASLILRFHDITNLMFLGSGAHSVWDVDLTPGERYRALRMPTPGRSLTAALGVRTPLGVFLPLAHAGPTHLPRESLSTDGTARTLRSLPRR